MKEAVQVICYGIFFLLLPFTAQPQVFDAANCAVNAAPVITPQVEYVKTVQPVSVEELIAGNGIEAFKKLPDKPVIFSGYDPYYYSFRFFIKNEDTISKPLRLLMGPIGISDAELFVVKNRTPVSLAKNGYRYSFEKRAYPHCHYVFPFFVHSQSVDTFYLITDNQHTFKTVAFSILHPDALIQKQDNVYFLFGIMLGALLLFFITNLYLWLTQKESIHCWYSIYVLMLILLLMKNEHLDEQFLGTDSELGYRLSPIQGIGSLCIFFLMHVICLFFRHQPNGKMLTTISNIVKWNLLLSAIAHFIVFYIQPGYKTETFFFEWANKSTLLGVVMIMINCTYYLIRGFKPAIMVFIGTFVFLMGAIERLLVVSNATYLFPPSLFQVGMIAEAGIISFALMYRYSIYKNEKDKLSRELQQQKLNEIKQVIAAQELEQARIAADLHDELGGNLAAIKMVLQGIVPPHPAAEQVTGLIDKASENARNIAHNLMPPEFGTTSLTELLRNYFNRLGTTTSVRFHFLSSGEDNYFDKQETIMVYRILLELTNNILKHSEADEATVQLVYYDKYLEIMVEDNGKGFSGNIKKGMGIKNIESRVKFLEGKITIDSGGKGTTVMIQVPYKILYL